ncbi:hypothetical protein J3R83DRAFT_13360 [Lanmaoa asiatica]|nr:hypothetical protein J3R83DRAFT_13360 [Lanmaoa asiatica]
MAAWLWASAQANTGDASVPHYATILFGVSSVLGTVILFLERCYFSRSILKASRNHLLAFVFFVFCVFTFTAALGAACVFFTNATADLTSQLSSTWIFPLVIISGLVCDLAITIVTAFYLRSQTLTEVADCLGWSTRMHAWRCVLLSRFVTVFDVTINPVFANTLLAGSVTPPASRNPMTDTPPLRRNRLNARGHLCADIQHQRTFKVGDKLIDERVNRPPIMITISKKVEKQSERSPV